MMKESKAESRDLSEVVSIIAPGMKVVGDCSSDGIVRIEGRVEGLIKAAKSVVVGKDGVVKGDIETQDVIVAGRVSGTITAQSRVELQASCHVEGDIRSRRIKLDEGGHVDGRLHMGADVSRTESQQAALQRARGAPQPGAAPPKAPGKSSLQRASGSDS
ncbi:MAG: polymer-forming cytoskeletal protein [Gemmatimonadota bacterium]|jgi:cytoskeletal protein CcmA (bactofilin family)